MLKQIRRTAVCNMRNYNLIDYIKRKVEKQNKNIDETLDAKEKFKRGEIDIHRLYKIGTFEKSGCRIEFCGCMNISEGKIKSGLLVKINGNWDYMSNITYYGNSTVDCYKIRFYINENSILVKKAWTSFDWNYEKINQLFDLEFIKICLDNLHGKKRREFVSLIKYLCEVRYHLSSDMLFDEVERF